MGCGFSRFMKDGEGGPGNGPLAPVDVWRGEDVHVDVAGRGRKRLPQGIAVPPSVHKAEDCPPGEHRHDRFDYCHPEKRKHRGGAKAKGPGRPFPPSRTIGQESKKAFQAWYHAKRAPADPQADAMYERYRQLRELYGMARAWERSPEGQAWISREKVKRAKGQGLKSREHYEAKIAALEEKKEQLTEEHERLWEQYRMPRLSSEREHYYEELRENTKQLKAVRAGIKRAKSLSTIGFAREWTGVIKQIAGGVEPQISAIRTGSRSFAHYSMESGIIGLSDHALEILEKIRNDPDLLWKQGPNLRPDRAAFAVSALVHEFLHSVNPPKDAYVKGGISGMIEEGLAEAISNRMVARPDVLSKLLGTEVERGIVAKPDTVQYKVYTDTVEYLAELAARKSNSDPAWFLGKWKFHTATKTRGETILADAGMEDEPTWRNIIEGSGEKLQALRKERLAQRANKAFQSAVSMAMNSLWRVAGFEFKGDKYPPETPAPTGGGGSGPATSPGALVPAGMDVRHTGSPPKGVGRKKFPRQGGAPGGTGAGAVEAAVEEPCEECYN